RRQVDRRGGEKGVAQESEGAGQRGIRRDSGRSDSRRNQEARRGAEDLSQQLRGEFWFGLHLSFERRGRGDRPRERRLPGQSDQVAGDGEQDSPDFGGGVEQSV